MLTHRHTDTHTNTQTHTYKHTHGHAYTYTKTQGRRRKNPNKQLLSWVGVAHIHQTRHPLHYNILPPYTLPWLQNILESKKTQLL